MVWMMYGVEVYLNMLFITDTVVEGYRFNVLLRSSGCVCVVLDGNITPENRLFPSIKK